MRKTKFHKGRWAVERERNHLANAEPPKPHPGHEALKDFIPGALKKMGLKDQGWLQEIAANWNAIAGDQISINSRPGRYDSGVLTVYVSHPMWITELKGGGENLILGRLQEQFGKRKIRSLRLQIDPGDDE